MNGRDKRRERARRANVDWPWVPDYLPDYRAGARLLLGGETHAWILPHVPGGANREPYPFSWRGRGG